MTAPNTLDHGSLDSLPTVILTHGGSGSRVEITQRGATVLSWKAPWRRGLGDFMEGFVSEEDFNGQSGMRNGLLFPVQNRLRDARYSWDGKTYSVPMQCPSDPEPIHGFVRLHDWTLIATDLDHEDRVSVVFAFSIRPGDHDWYPFSLDLTVHYELTADSLNVEFRCTNVGDTDAPVNFGWHPYYRIPGHETFDDLALRIPTRAQVNTDDALIPLPGDAAYDVRASDVIHETLADVHYDTAFTALVRDEDGIIRTRLTEGIDGPGLALWQERGGVLVYTEGNYPRYRGSVAIEPVESLTDAFNRPDRQSEVRLEAGTERVFRFGASVVQ